MTVRRFALATLAAAAFATPVAAHHSFAMFDATKSITVNGIVKEFEWVNPHSWVRVMVKDEQSGREMQWAFELGPPAQQIRRGWKSDSLKPGDKISLVMHPWRDGSRGGQLILATLPDGRTVGGAGAPPIDGGPAGPANQ